MAKDVKKNGYTLRMNKYKRNPFRPMPRLRTDPKSRRQHKIDNGKFCIRKWKKDKDGKDVQRCKNWRRCAKCVTFYELFEEVT